MTDIITAIKEIAVSSIFSDDILKNIFVLKGGNALNLVYNITDRASIDIDLSIQSTLDDLDITDITKRIKMPSSTVFVMRATQYLIIASRNDL